MEETNRLHDAFSKKVVSRNVFDLLTDPSLHALVCVVPTLYGEQEDCRNIAINRGVTPLDSYIQDPVNDRHFGLKEKPVSWIEGTWKKVLRKDLSPHYILEEHEGLRPERAADQRDKFLPNCFLYVGTINNMVSEIRDSLSPTSQ
jgi:hypothetical protein